MLVETIGVNVRDALVQTMMEELFERHQLWGDLCQGEWILSEVQALSDNLFACRKTGETHRYVEVVDTYHTKGRIIQYLHLSAVMHDLPARKGLPMGFRPDRKGSFTFHFSEVPAVESTWCLNNCPLERPGRCCTQYRPRFGLFDLMLLSYLDQHRFHLLLKNVRGTLHLQTPYLIVGTENTHATCNLWTPQGCRLPVNLRPTTCRTYFCRPSVFGGNAELRETNGLWIDALQTVVETQDGFKEWSVRCNTEYRERNHDLFRDAGPEVSTMENPLARNNLVEFTNHYRSDFETYLNRVRRQIAERIGKAGPVCREFIP